VNLSVQVVEGIMALKLPDTLYLVQCVRWEQRDYSDADSPLYVCPDAEQGAPERAFAERDRADEYCAELEREKRSEVNPFDYCVSIDELMDFDADRWHDWILDAGLEPPRSKKQLVRGHWRDWWDEAFPKMTELQRAKVWQALAKLRFYRVVELQAASGW
jgi:hypothetical protein